MISFWFQMQNEEYKLFFRYKKSSFFIFFPVFLNPIGNFSVSFCYAFYDHDLFHGRSRRDPRPMLWRSQSHGHGWRNPEKKTNVRYQHTHTQYVLFRKWLYHYFLFLPISILVLISVTDAIHSAGFFPLNTRKQTTKKNVNNS